MISFVNQFWAALLNIVAELASQNPKMKLLATHDQGELTGSSVARISTVGIWGTDYTYNLLLIDSVLHIYPAMPILIQSWDLSNPDSNLDEIAAEILQIATIVVDK